MSYQSMRRGGSLILYVSSGSFEIESEAIGLETGYVGLMLGQVFFSHLCYSCLHTPRTSQDNLASTQHANILQLVPKCSKTLSASSFLRIRPRSLLAIAGWIVEEARYWDACRKSGHESCCSALLVRMSVCCQTCRLHEELVLQTLDWHMVHASNTFHSAALDQNLSLS